jgi:glycosyltransferase involved in cell wall biosynthesis
VPYPPKDGGAIAMLNMTKAFYQLGHELHLLVFNTKKHFVKDEDLPPLFRQIASYQKVYLDADVTLARAVANLFSGDSFHISRFYSEEFNETLSKTLQAHTFDVIQIEGLHMTIYLPTIRKYSKAKVSLRAHNVEYIIWERLADAETSLLKKWYVKLLAERLKKYELKTLQELDAIVPITNHDAGILKQLGIQVPMFVSPTGIDLEQYPMDRSQLEWPSVFHLGALDWQPNQQAVQWFLEQVWPALHERFPNLTFYLAGRNMPDWILNLNQKGVIVAGEVDSAIDFINSKGIMAVPLLAGSGMRIKIIEGMALGKTIVATSIGAEGIHYTNGKNIMIADTPQVFADAIARCIEDRAFSEQLGQSARQLIEQEYDNQALVKKLVKFYEEL